MNWIANKPGCLKPTEDRQVIVTTLSPFASKHVSEAWYDHLAELWYENGHDISESVIAWMPMPAPADLEGYAESIT
jgi:hypothetical protein